MGWRVALIVTAALQLGVTWLRLLADDGHPARELAFLDLGLAVGFLVVILLDAVTRDSFTGFPTAFLGMLLIGITLAAAHEIEEAAEQPASPARA